MKFARRVAGRIAREIDAIRLFRKMGREFRNDPNYRPDLVAQGCLDRTQHGIDDSAILNRIVISYSKAKIAQQNAPATYQVSNEWLPIYNRNLRNSLKFAAL